MKERKLAMQGEQPFLKEIRSVQYLVSILVIVTLINALIITALRWSQMDTLTNIVALLGALGYDLFFLVLAWQLGKRRKWIWKILLILTSLNILGFFVMIVQLFINGPIQGNLLYKIYYYGISVISVLLYASINSHLTKSSVRDAFQEKHARTSPSDISQ